MKTGYKVCDAMTKKPLDIPADSTIEQASKMMKENHVGSLIVKEGAKVKGILTEQDIVRKVIAKGNDPKRETVGSIILRDLISIEPQEDIYEALVVMRDNNIRHLPVMDGKNMIGFLTIKDILKIQPQLFDIIVEKFELREEKEKPI
jgi:signal-transduction protein with cAMP-binding, CBS, and nucleotidyltransferase domain